MQSNSIFYMVQKLLVWVVARVLLSCPGMLLGCSTQKSLDEARILSSVQVYGFFLPVLSYARWKLSLIPIVSHIFWGIIVTCVQKGLPGNIFKFKGGLYSRQ